MIFQSVFDVIVMSHSAWSVIIGGIKIDAARYDATLFKRPTHLYPLYLKTGKKKEEVHIKK